MEYTHLYAIICSFVLVCRVIAYETINNGTLGPPSIEDVINRISVLESFILPLPADQLDQLIHETVTRYVPINAQSELCRQHSLLVVEAFHQRHLWALKMLDAGTKMMSGILDGHLQDLGNFEQCVNIIQPDNLFNGQLCVVQTAGLLDQNIQQTIIPTDITFSICVPSSCTVEDVATHVDTVLAQVNASTMYSFVKNSGVEVDFIDKFLSCSDQVKPRFRLEDYIALIVFIAAGCFLLTLTIFETKFGTKSVFSGLSLNSSLKGLADTDAPGNEISCLNGFRVICIILVIAYNRLHGMMYLMPSSRRNTIVETLSTVTLRLFEASTISIEIFLLISGTVATYTFFVKKEKQQQLPLWKSYLIRYFRLTPALAVMMLFYATLSIHMSQGPLWPQSAERMENPCRSYWWTGLLHISNYYNADNVCVSQSWYVALVFQLHVLSPLVLIPLYKTPKMWSLWIIPNIVGPVAAMVVKSYVGEFYPGSMLNEIELQRETNYSSAVDYQGFHLKLCYYVIGIGLGYILFLIKHNKKEISFSKPFFTLGWTVSGLVLTAYLSLSLVILHPDHTFRPWFDPLFNGLAKPLTSLALAWVIFACSLGHGGIVNRFLSWSAFRPLARLVYGVYLVHVLVLLTQCYSVQVPQAFTYTEYMFLVFGDITVSFALAVVLYLAVEVPCSKLANNLLTDSKLNEVENVTTQKLPPIVPTLNENMKSSKL